VCGRRLGRYIAYDSVAVNGHEFSGAMAAAVQVRRARCKLPRPNTRRRRQRAMALLLVHCEVACPTTPAHPSP
jgi:hypothetical protein